MSLLSAGAALPESVAPYAALMGAGFIVAILGHLSQSRWTITIGIIMIFLATLLLPLALEITTDDPPERPGPQLPNP